MADPLQLAQSARSYQDILKEHQLSQLQAGVLQNQALSGANTYATQILSGAAPGGQQAWDQARQHLQQQGIDVSNWAPDVQTGAQQAQAARLAQSPLGSLLNTATKFDTNNNTAIISGGNVPGSPNAIAQSVLGGGLNALIPGAAALMPRQNLQPNPAQAIAAQIPQITAPAQASVPPPAGTTEAAMGRFSNASAPPVKEPGETLEAYKARVELWKSDPSYQGAVEAAKGQGQNFAKDEQSAAQAQAIFGKLQENINALRQLNPTTPSDAGLVSVDTGANINNRLAGIGIGSGEGAGKVAQWHQIDTQQTLNELSQLVQSGAIRSNKAIVQLLATGASIPVGLNANGRAQMLDNLEKELKNAVASSQNVVQSAQGQPQNVPYNQINTNSQSQKVWQVQNDNDYNLLPSGAQFTGPDGQVRVKP